MATRHSMVRGSSLVFLLLALAFALAGCPAKDDSGDLYCCAWESRYSSCGGGSPWSDWTASYDEFRASDYYISPEEHCANMASDSTSCAGSCCIYHEGRYGSLRSGSCN